MYVPGGDDWWKTELEPDAFAHAVRATRFLVDNAFDAGVFSAADYLNVNAPVAESQTAPMRVTAPSDWYGLRADANGDGEVHFSDPIWGRMTPEDVPDPVGTDRRAVVDGEVSVSPLTVPHGTASAASLDDLADTYREARGDKSAVDAE